MIEELRGLLAALEHVPNAAMWGVGIFLAYKMILYLGTTGSIVYVLKLAIERFYAGYCASKNVPPNFNSVSITSDGTGERIKQLVSSIRSGTGSDYLHGFHADWLEDAIRRQKERFGPPSHVKNWKEDSE